MEMKELLEFVRRVSERLTKGNPESTEAERVFARMVKLTEEVGELADEVLVSQGDQRKEKLEGKNEESLGDEIADVLITTLVLAASLNVDVPKALARKIVKIETRLYDGIR